MLICSAKFSFIVGLLLAKIMVNSSIGFSAEDLEAVASGINRRKRGRCMSGTRDVREGRPEGETAGGDKKTFIREAELAKREKRMKRKNDSG